MNSDEQFDPHKFSDDLRTKIRSDIHERIRAQGLGSHPRMGSGGMWPGLILVIIGTAILLSHMGIIPGDRLWRYWPVILILVGAVRFFEAGNRAGSVLLMLFGGLFLLGNLGYLRLSWGELWPIAIIALGVMMIWGRMALPRLPANQSGVSSSGNVVATTIFGGVERRITSSNFTGGTISATFGGIELDFRAADIEGEEAILYIEALFGGIEVIIPERWMAIYEGQSIFGGYNDETRAPLPEVPGAPPKKRLILRGQAIFGGITVKN